MISRTTRDRRRGKRCCSSLSEDGAPVSRRPLRRELPEPLAGDQLERRLRRLPLGPPLRGRIDSSREGLPCRFPAVPRVLERDVRIRAERQELFFPLEPVLPSPELCARGREQKKQAAAVEQLDGLRGGLRPSDGGIGEWHRSILPAAPAYPHELGGIVIAARLNTP